MGGSKPSAPTVIMPAETKPQQFQSVIPEKSFKDLAEQMGRIEKETGKIQQQRYDEVGTPAEIGARSKGTNMLAAAAYLSSLPKSTPDTSFQTTPRPFDITSTKGAFEQKDRSDFTCNHRQINSTSYNSKKSARFCKRSCKTEFRCS